MKFTKPIKKLTGITIEILLIIPCFCICIISRFTKRPIDVGMGPLPLVNNVYLKGALRQAGFSAETFVISTWFITDEFDFDLTKWRTHVLLKHFSPFYLFGRALFRYRVLFICYNGGPFILKQYFLHALEPIFYKLAKTKIVVMPYGGDIQVLTRCKNMHFRHTVVSDYPNFKRNYALNLRNIDRWTRHANWVLASGDAVDYMYHWDSLTVNFLPIDTQRWAPTERTGHQEDTRLRILHAPNHPMIKGTDDLIKAIELLKREGLDIELNLLRGVPNNEIQSAMADADLVADQFVMGWYGMFAIEAMSMGKPVLCYLREDLIKLFVKAGLVIEGEIPLVNTDLLDIASRIKWAYNNREEIKAIGKKGREYVQNHHSTAQVGRNFAKILNELEIEGQ
jgi:glycosyltransferase involved in cell wall biosynthesis